MSDVHRVQEAIVEIVTKKVESDPDMWKAGRLTPIGLAFVADVHLTTSMFLCGLLYTGRYTEAEQ